MDWIACDNGILVTVHTTLSRDLLSDLSDDKIKI